MAEEVVVGVDGSPNALEALRWAARLARDRGAILRVVTAWTWDEVVGVPGARFPVETEDEGQARAEKVLDGALEAVGDADLDGVEVERAARFGNAVQVLLEAADDADALVVGSRGRGGFKGLLLGSVSQQCVTHATRPTVVIPAQGA